MYPTPVQIIIQNVICLLKRDEKKTCSDCESAVHFLIAAAISLPELLVSLAALRIIALDIAVRNILGSNIFNSFMLSMDIVFCKRDSLFKAISPSHM